MNTTDYIDLTVATAYVAARVQNRPAPVVDDDHRLAGYFLAAALTAERILESGPLVGDETRCLGETLRRYAARDGLSLEECLSVLGLALRGDPPTTLAFVDMHTSDWRVSFVVHAVLAGFWQDAGGLTQAEVVEDLADGLRIYSDWFLTNGLAAFPRAPRDGS